MIKITSDLKLIVFNRKAWDRATKIQMKAQIQGAARYWLTTVLTVIPTWSRASRATFESLAQEVGFQITYGPRLSREDRTELGLATSRGGLDLGKDSWFFFYTTDLQYLAYNNFNHVVYGEAPNVFSRTGLTHPTPYKFTELGEDAFKRFAERVRLPDPMLFIQGVRLTGSGSERAPNNIGYAQVPIRDIKDQIFLR